MINYSLKYTILILFLFLLNACARIAEKGIPDTVHQSFEKKHSGENDPDWEKDKNENYEASFKKSGIHYRADFSPNGQWIETESSIKKKELSDAVKDKIKSDYDDIKIVEIEKVDHHSKGIFYDVEFKDKGGKI